MIKYIFLLCIVISNVSAQSKIDLLKGTWKTIDNESFEHWDQMDSNKLKGFSYYFKNNQMIVSEYLEIRILENQIIYEASVIGANSGKTIAFQCIKNDSTLIFENLNHDFPQRISYQFINKDEIFINLNGKNNKTFQYKLIRKY